MNFLFSVAYFVEILIRIEVKNHVTGYLYFYFKNINNISIFILAGSIMYYMVWEVGYHFLFLNFHMYLIEI